MITLKVLPDGNKYNIDWIGRRDEPYVVCFTIGGIKFKSPRMSRKEAETMKDALWTLTQHECQHPKVIPTFDEEAAKGLSAREIRKRWPRFDGKCPDCEFNGSLYASYAHYICGDY